MKTRLLMWLIGVPLTVAAMIVVRDYHPEAGAPASTSLHDAPRPAAAAAGSPSHY